MLFELYRYQQIIEIMKALRVTDHLDAIEQICCEGAIQGPHPPSLPPLIVIPLSDAPSVRT
jgi:hypothetical protein